MKEKSNPVMVILGIEKYELLKDKKEIITLEIWYKIWYEKWR